MNTTHARQMVAQELELFPDENLPDLYRFIHYFRLGLLTNGASQAQIVTNGGASFQSIPAQPDNVETNIDPNAEIDEAVEREKAAFIALHPTLLAKYRGEEVAIYQGQVVDHDKDGVALSLRIYKRFPDEFVLISPVTTQPMEEWVNYSFRFETLETESVN